jgi:hypothetical protein
LTPKEILFKREDAQQVLKGSPHLPGASLSPRPGLRRNQIDHRNPHPFEARGEA